ncbi:MAG TPA: hypothetical protein VMV49_01945 [Candidatus Deferrimicrobium sp.]|nr:hypothetical protein [Candidatus Deferrimicrobium sp.]
MRKITRNQRGCARTILLIVVLSILISVQVYAATLNQSHAAYYGIQFGTEEAVGIDAANDIWKLDKLRYNYVANGQVKPEIDLLGLNISRDANELVVSDQCEIITNASVNDKFDYNFTYLFDISLTDLINVSYTFQTNQTYVTSAIEFYNWTDDTFHNESAVENITTAVLLPLEYYSEQIILIHFNITHSTNFTVWFNVTFEFCYIVHQVITLRFESLIPGNNTLVDNLKAWIFLDTDGDDKLNYAIEYLYGNGTFLYQIKNTSFSLGGWWNGKLEKYWTGANWAEGSGLKKDIGNLTINNLNITVPEFAVNLTPTTIKYAVWSQKIETNYDWWDALPDDPQWEIATNIPGFELALVGLCFIIIALLFSLRQKRTINIINKLV